MDVRMMHKMSIIILFMHRSRTDLSVKNAFFWEVFLRSEIRLLVTANVVPSSPILVTLMMEGSYSFEISVLTGAIRFNIPEDDVLHRHSSGNFGS
jgi:hypothetical protein